MARRLKGAPDAQSLAVGLVRSSHVRRGDRRERDDLDGVDLDLAGTDLVSVAPRDRAGDRARRSLSRLSAAGNYRRRGIEMVASAIAHLARPKP